MQRRQDGTVSRVFENQSTTPDERRAEHREFETDASATSAQRATVRKGRNDCPRCWRQQLRIILAMPAAEPPDEESSSDSTIGCERLSSAVLTEAFVDLRRGICPDCAGPTERYRCLDAIRWFESTDKDWLLSFENVCRRLQIDPPALRETVRSILRSVPREET
jgi:hypothetical protein